VRWVEQVTDVAAPWTLELETLGTPPVSWRLRLWLVEQLDGDTRVRIRLTYRPSGLRRRLADRLFLRRTLERHTQSLLAGLARSFAPLPAGAEPVDTEGELVDAEVELTPPVDAAVEEAIPVAA
jgi:hypothetical protein